MHWIARILDRAARRARRLLPVAVLAACWLFASPTFAAPVRILAFGDSLTAGYGLKPEEAFPPVLGQRLRADGFDVVIANGGVSGDTTRIGLARLPAALAAKPDLVILELGANDMLNGIDPKTTRANLDRMIRLIRARGARIILAGMQSAEHGGTAYKRRFDAIYPALAAKYALPFYPFFLAAVAGHPDLVLWGGLHPKPEGVRIIADRMAPLVERTLAEMGAKPR